LRLFSFGGYGLALAALALVVFGAYDSYPFRNLEVRLLHVPSKVSICSKTYTLYTLPLNEFEIRVWHLSSLCFGPQVRSSAFAKAKNSFISWLTCLKMGKALRDNQVSAKQRGEVAVLITARGLFTP